MRLVVQVQAVADQLLQLDFRRPFGPAAIESAPVATVSPFSPIATAAKLHSPGVIIQSVRSGSFADLQGLVPGLVIIRVNRQPTGTKEQFSAVVSKLKTGDDVVFEIMDPRHPDDGINLVGGTLE